MPFGAGYALRIPGTMPNAFGEIRDSLPPCPSQDDNGVPFSLLVLRKVLIYNSNTACCLQRDKSFKIYCFIYSK